MMGRVSAEMRHREPGQLETGTEGRAEHGPGAARLRDEEVLRPRRERPSQRQGMSVPGKARSREGRVKQGGTTKRYAFVLDKSVKDVFLYPKPPLNLGGPRESGSHISAIK